MDEIQRLKKERNAVILAHYYIDDEIKKIADYVGDSYNLCRVAAEVPQDTILFCGVTFMGESAKILNPQKTVLIPEKSANCPMAFMADTSEINEIRNKYEDVAVVCYINSTAEVKANSDVCVTSSNAVDIIHSLPNKYIYFIPDGNLGRYVASVVKDKEFIFGKGYCHVHTDIKPDGVEQMLNQHPDAKVLVHPECTPDVVNKGDYAGSTSGIIDYAAKSSAQDFIICTESGILFELKNLNPNKNFYFPNAVQTCPNMKKITPDKVLNSLKSMEHTVELDEALRIKAFDAISKMLRLARCGERAL